MPSSNNIRLEIEKLRDKVKGKVDFFTILVCQRLVTDVVVATPGPGNSIAKHPTPRHPTGFLRGSWFAQIGSPPSSEAGKPDPSTSGSATISRCQIATSGMKAGLTFYMVNNASYAMRQEYGFVGTDALGRKYNQQGRFFVSGTVMRAKNIAEQVAEEVRSGNFVAPTGGISGGAFTAGPGRGLV